MKQLAPSILSADFICLGEQLKQWNVCTIYFFWYAGDCVIAETYRHVF